MRIVVGTVGIEGLLFYGGLAYLGAYLKLRFDLGYGVIGLIVAGFSLGGLLYSVSVQPLVRRLGEKGLVRVGGVVLLISFVGIVAAPTWWISVPFFIGIGFGFYMFHNTLQTRASEMAPHARGSAVSLFAFSLFLGQAAGVAVFGAGISLLGYVPMLVGRGRGPRSARPLVPAAVGGASDGIADNLEPKSKSQNQRRDAEKNKRERRENQASLTRSWGP